MTKAEKQARKDQLLDAVKEENRVAYQAIVNQLVELENHIEQVSKHKMIDPQLNTITPYANLYKQLTIQYADLFMVYSKATSGSMDEGPFEQFLQRYMEK